MRLDHLLSKETEEVKVALLSSCQGAMRWILAGAGERACTVNCELTKDDIGRTAEPERMRSISDGEDGRSMATNQRILPVAMRLGDTPVLIPNTMVKT